MNSPLPTEAVATTWILKELRSSDTAAREIVVSSLPFRIGRLPNLHACISAPSVSKLHAEIVPEGSAVAIRDLHSRNGTFVNGLRIGSTVRLNDGDIVQMGEAVFRVECQELVAPERTRESSACADALALLQFERLTNERVIVPHFQPIVKLEDRRLVGYELLARSSLEGLESPAEMFRTAERLDQQALLSQVLRIEGIRVGRQLPGRPNLFVNTHPVEVVTDELLASLHEARRLAQDQPITVEIHESSVTKMAAMQTLRHTLRQLGMQLAYDDFGAGQSRLDELTKAPPDYLKFDLRLIRNIHRVDVGRRRMVQSLVSMVRDLSITSLAEGIESREEADVCRDLGFELAQGFYFGRPTPATSLTRE
jgi:EAL domain-containing protein (putative c-di-GMP-specific phosphodiesterase class I)